MPTERIVLTPKGEFSLAESIRFLRGFTPLAGDGDGDRDDDGDALRLAFAVEGDWGAAGVVAHQGHAGRVTATITGDADAELVRAQLERMLSLDVDASSLPGAVAGDDVAAALVMQLRGLRPVLFASPYEAACWAVMSQRSQMTQTARVRARMCEEMGATVEVDGESMSAFPGPERLRRASSIRGLSAVKIERLHAIAAAALEGRLDAAALRAAGPERALNELRELPGIGPFAADLVLIRGAGEPDHFTHNERRLLAELADAYGVDAGDGEALDAIAEGWRPFRSWIGFLFRARAALAHA
jgi:3-methyladenine DNA glycosylase/8-oxoguanine DNA glycosylase